MTFLYTDIEDSTKLWEMFPGLDGPMSDAVTDHDHIVLKALADAGGYVFRRIGDAYCAALDTPTDGLRAAVAVQQGLASGPWQALREAVAARGGEGPVPANVDGALRVRMSLHMGAAELRDGDYFGGELNRVARLLSAAHGGQILVSGAAANWFTNKRRPLPDVRLDDLGRHRLKDLREDVEVYEARFVWDTAESPGVITLDGFQNNLPVQNTAFIGRVGEIDQLVRRVSAHHLTTVTGFAGSGKTRLALQAAAEMLGGYQGTRAVYGPSYGPPRPGDDEQRAGRPAPAAGAAQAAKPFTPFSPDDGAWFVDLQEVRDEGLVVGQVARALGVRERPGAALVDALVVYLRSKKLLLVLDNCETVLEGCVKLVRAVLPCGGVRVLATSREPLGVAGESLFRVPPMPVPDPASLPDLWGRGEADTLARFESIQLFLGTLRLSDPGYQISDENLLAIVRICARLDGLPLAIHSAAALAATLDVQTVAEQLDQSLDFPRRYGGEVGENSGLRTLIEQSYQRLNAGEQALLRRLSVFAGDWTFGSAVEVCSGEPVQKKEMMRLVSALVSKSLVERRLGGGSGNAAGSFRLLKIMRDYAREKLQESGEAREFLRRHMEWDQRQQIHPDAAEPEQRFDNSKFERDDARNAPEEPGAVRASAADVRPNVALHGARLSALTADDESQGRPERSPDTAVPSVFISYRREDSGGYAGRLYDRLADRLGRDRVFMDVDAIPLGADFVAHFRDAVGKCDVLLAVIGRGWLSATDARGSRRLDDALDFVRLEVEAALQRNVRVVPVLVGGAVMPKAAEMPETLRGLAIRNGMAVHDASFHSDVDRLIRALIPGAGQGRGGGAEGTPRPV